LRRNISLSIPSDLPKEMAEILTKDMVTAFDNRLEAMRENMRKKEAQGKKK